MQKKKIRIELGQLAYVVYNPTAEVTMVCFHGFGQKATDYAWLAEANSKVKIISIDLFFHGNSNLRKRNVLNTSDWKLFFDLLIKEEHLTKFSITGYSMGGRFALTTWLLYPKQVETIYLIAADGIKASKLFNMATSTSFMRGLFKAMLNSYPLFIYLSNALTRLGILNKGLQKFAQLHMRDKVERNRIFYSWTSFRNLKLPPHQIAAISAKNNTPVHIILGQYDRVIPVSRIKPYLVKNELLHYKTAEITHQKLFFYDFLTQ